MSEKQFNRMEFVMFNFSKMNDGVVEVVFTKKNGEKRVMRCTRKASLIPDEDMPKGVERAHNPEVVKAYDLDKKAWRSFRKDSVISVSLSK